MSKKERERESERERERDRKREYVSGSHEKNWSKKWVLAVVEPKAAADMREKRAAKFRGISDFGSRVKKRSERKKRNKFVLSEQQLREEVEREREIEREKG